MKGWYEFKMELKFDSGEYVKNAYGGFRTVSGRDELLQRALMRLSARRGSFFPLPDFGSELHTLFSMKKSQRAAAARRMVYEALEPEKELAAENVDYRETGDGTALVTVTLRLAGGGSGTVSVPVG